MLISFLSASLVLNKLMLNYLFICLTCITFKIDHYEECGPGQTFHSYALLFIQTHALKEVDQIAHPCCSLV